MREKEIEKERQVRDRKRFKLLAPAVRLTERTFNEREGGKKRDTSHFLAFVHEHVLLSLSFVIPRSV